MVFHRMSSYRPFGQQTTSQADPSWGRKRENLTVSSDLLFVKCSSCGHRAGLHHLRVSVSHQTLGKEARDERWGTQNKVLYLLMSPQNTGISDWKLTRQKIGKAKIIWKCSSETSDVTLKSRMRGNSYSTKSWSVHLKSHISVWELITEKDKTLEYVHDNKDRGQNHIPK